MLRVRPIHFTSRPDEWGRLLTALGMVKTTDDGDWQEFDAGSGRVALHRVDPGSPESADADSGAADSAGARDGRTEFGVEVGDLAEFARRTNAAAAEDGTSPAELVRAAHGEACRITGADGFAFFADKAGPGAQGADADPALAVAAVWFTPDAAAAAQTLRNMGARLRPSPDADETADFTAKNGGVLMVRPASGMPHCSLGFEYTGDLSALQNRLAAAGYRVSVTEEAFGRTLHVANPDVAGPERAGLPDGPAHGPALWVSAKPTTG